MRIAMVSPRREACGVSDYTDTLVREMTDFVDVAHFVDPAGFRAEMNDGMDLVHVQHEYFVFGGVAPWKSRVRSFLRKVKRPVVMTVHEIVGPSGNPAYRAAIRLSNRLHFLHPSVKRYIVHTEQDRKRLASAGISPDRIEVIRHGVPPSPDLMARNEAKQLLGLEDRFVITIFGFMARKKGHFVALDALNELPEDVTLVIAGGKHPEDTTGYVDEVTARAREQGVRARITGYLPSSDVLVYMAATDLILAPFSDSSGSGSLALAFACGMPILASDIEPHREILLDTPGSMRMFGRTEQDLAREIVSLRNDPSEIEHLRQGAGAYAEAHSFRAVAEQTARLYDGVAQETSR